MHALAALLLVTSLSIPTPTLVLRSGERIDVIGPVTLDGKVMLFHAPGGALYSIPTSEVDLDATRAAATAVTVSPSTTQTKPAEPARKLHVSEDERKRLLKQLEENHAGTAGSEPVFERPDGSTPEQRAAGPTNDAEWAWRNRMRSYEEAVRQAEENRALLVRRAEELRSHIASLTSLGYKTSQFTYDTTQLQMTVEQIPAADLEVTRAQRALEQFRDDARRQGVMPGWLR